MGHVSYKQYIENVRYHRTLCYVRAQLVRLKILSPEDALKVYFQPPM